MYSDFHTYSIHYNRITCIMKYDTALSFFLAHKRYNETYKYHSLQCFSQVLHKLDESTPNARISVTLTFTINTSEALTYNNDFGFVRCPKWSSVRIFYEGHIAVTTTCRHHSKYIKGFDKIVSWFFIMSTYQATSKEKAETRYYLNAIYNAFLQYVYICYMIWSLSIV